MEVVFCVPLLPFGIFHLQSEIGVFTQTRHRNEKKNLPYLEHGTDKCHTEQDQMQAGIYLKSSPRNIYKIEYIEEETALVNITESSQHTAGRSSSSKSTVHLGIIIHSFT